MSRLLFEVANRLVLDGDELRRENIALRRYYQRLGKSPSSIGAATKGLGMSRVQDRVRALVTGDSEDDEAALAFGPSAGLVLSVSLGAASLRAAIVDANGWLHDEQIGEECMGQLELEPRELFERIRLACEAVLDRALGNPRLLVDGALPFLGLAVAWPVPLDTEKLAHSALTHALWRSNPHGLDQLLARHLQIERTRSHAVNDAAAAALAVAFDDARSASYRTRSHPHQLVVVRLGGGLGASTVVVEPEKDGVSGWMNSPLHGGHRGLAGEIGHTPVDHGLLTDLARNRLVCPPLKRVRCSCARGREQPDHVEAYVCGAALAARFAKRGRSVADTIDYVLANAGEEPHRSALEEAGRLLGGSLLPSVLMLAPHEIVLTGRLARNEVAEGLEAQLDDSGVLARVMGGTPNVRALSGKENDFVRVRGAALAVLREHLHRRLEHYFNPSAAVVARRLKELTQPLVAYPWSPKKRTPSSR